LLRSPGNQSKSGNRGVPGVSAAGESVLSQRRAQPHNFLDDNQRRLAGAVA